MTSSLSQTLLVPNVADTLKERDSNRLMCKQFEQLGRNDRGVEVRPSVIHFGGYQIHHEHSTQVRILNASAESLRLTILPPTTKFFRISYDKKGLLAPGMSEDITIVFTPLEWRYYYDTVKVFCDDRKEGEGANVLIPIHGYPSVNELKFPRFIDFGNVAMWTSRTKVIPLSCNIPIEFEFEITIKQDHEDFAITPMKGIIPANGTLNVAITFLPTKARTCLLTMLFNAAQFNFTEVQIDAMGSCRTDTTRDELLTLGRADLDEIREARRREDIRERVQKLEDKKRSGQWCPVEVKLPTFAPEEIHRLIKDVPIPPVEAQSSMNFVMNQKPGKLPLRAFREFVLSQREKADARLEKALQGTDDDEGSDDDIQAKEMRFTMKWRDTEVYDKSKELKGISEIGEDPTTEKEATRVKARRETKQEELLTKRLDTSQNRCETSISCDPVSVSAGFEVELTPQWDEYENDSFAMRLQVIDRFVRAGSKCLMRVRATTRLQKLLEAMSFAGAKDRTTTKAWVEAENKAAAMGAKQKKNDDILTDAADFILTEDFVCPPSIPIAVQSMGSESFTPVEVNRLGNFIEFTPLTVRPGDDYKIEAYGPIPQPPPSQYMRLNVGRRSNYRGALEEQYIRGPCGDAFDGAEAPLARPDSCLHLPAHDPMNDVCVPSPEVRVWVGTPYDYTETDVEYRLSEPLPVRPWKTRVPYVLSNLEIDDEPWVQTWRTDRALVEPLGICDPAAESLAMGREKPWTNVGGNCRGGALMALPHGGNHWDIPSDTDSDGRDNEFNISGPDDNYLEEYFDSELIPKLLDADAEITNDRWDKSKALERKLEEKARARDEALRIKLTEFNELLDYRNRLYLG
eukprot:GEMP01015290.1.p1 GENE.GEMP01015290.1~~GEMP01015290.1.p1  ORF type:complete len:857 (+),score=193.28 GEMP01015290.1:31-2601(+)